MPRKLSLRGFLRQDILLRRSKALLPLNNKNTSGLKREAGAVLPLDNRAKSRSPPPEDDEGEREVDSIFGEPIYTKTEIQQQKLEQFLEENQKDQPDTKTNRNATLDKLREELDTIVKREFEASPEERVEIRRAKSQLIEEIGKLEARDRIERVRGHKASSDEEARLPEPIGLAEKKRLQSAKARVTKAVLGLEGSSKKRKREDDDYELDGEDRLRAGVKQKELPLTGRWYSRIHDYFPEPENGVDGAGAAERFLTAEERQLNRRELAEYGEMLAKAERSMKEKEARRVREEEARRMKQKEAKEMRGKRGRVGRL